MDFTVYYMNGTIPAPIFVENLVKNIAHANVKVIIFGKKNGDYIDSDEVIKVIYQKKSFLRLIITNISYFLKLSFKNFRQSIKFFEIVTSLGIFKYSTQQLIGNVLPIILTNPDIVHIQWATHLNIFSLLTKVYKGKVIVSLRGAHINYTPLLNNKIRLMYEENFPYLDGFHAVSEAIKKEAIKYNADEKKIKVIRSFVSQTIICKYSEEAKNNKVLTIISVGRFHWKKGYIYSIDAMKLIEDKGYEVKYKIIAGGKIPEDIQYYVATSNNKNIEIINGLPHAEVINEIKKSDIFLLPSIEEGIANVVLEAMAVGTFVISTDCGGMNEAIENDLSGFLVSIRDSNAIANAILKFKEFNHAQKLIMIRSAHEKILKDFNQELQVNNFVDFYKEVLNSN